MQAVAHGTSQGAMTGIQGGNFWSGFAAGALSSIAASVWSGGTTETTGFSAENNWAYGAKTITHAGLGAGTGTAGMIAFGTVMGGAGAALTGGNFWQGAVTGLVVSGLNHGFHNGKKINNNGGDTTDYNYDDNGNIIETKSVLTIGSNDGRYGGKLTMRGYGFKSYTATGAITPDNSLVGLYSGFKVAQLGWFSLRNTYSNVYGEKMFESSKYGYRSLKYGRYHPKYLKDGVKGTSNSGWIRTGWGNNNGQNVFRTSIRHTPNQKHIDWFWVP